MTDIDTKFLHYFSKFQERVTHLHVGYTMDIYTGEQANRELKKARYEFESDTEESSVQDKIKVFNKLFKLSRKCERYWYPCGSCKACVIQRAIEKASEDL